MGIEDATFDDTMGNKENVVNSWKELFVNL